jgi:outer membrane protein OmpA-like peptidoglycan-associated protein
MLMKKIKIMAIFAVGIWLLSACAGSKLQVEPIALSENPTERINLLNTDLEKARKNKVNVLAPTWYAKAETSFNNARARLERGDELSVILQNVAEGRAQVQRAEEMANIARTAMPDAIEARDLARAAGATNFEEDYAKVEEQFLELTKAIEKNDLQYAQRNKAKVTKAFDELELRAIKEYTIGEVRNLIKQAEKERANKIAPKTFAVAQEKLTEADAFISKHRYQKEQVHEKAGEALFQARRLLQVTRQSKTVETMQPEQITLWVEDILYKTSNKLSARDMRNEPFKTQVENIIGSITALQEDHQFMLDKVKAQQGEIQARDKQIASLEGRTLEQQAAKDQLSREKQEAKDRLAAERRFHDLFRKVERDFGPTEGEVYKQGNQLVIRLKGIQFPVGKYIIMPDNYALLSKVQRAIRTFGEPDVVIEGHTDSTGTEELNTHLSQRRADSVREYLIANKTLSSKKIIAVGYGSERPLASNQTEDGRAINRRIDVIVKPEIGIGQ